MFQRKYNKQNKFKRLLLKLLNVYAYEKETLNIVNPNYNNNQKDYIKFNDKSFKFTQGYLELTRKIKSLDIFFRYSPTNNLWNSTERWKRIIPNIDKKTLISVCLLSLKDSLSSFIDVNNIKTNFHLISDNSSIEFDDQLISILNSDKINIFSHTSKIKGNRGTYLECCDLAENSEDLIFFIEDDYLFETECIEEMILSYSRFSTILKKDIFMCPSDYPFFYDSLYLTSLFLGNNYKWRNIGETLLTIMFSKNIYNEHRDKIRKVGLQENDPFEKPLHEIYKDVCCLAPINTLSHHISRAVPSIDESWLTLWRDKFQKYKDLNFIQQ